MCSLFKSVTADKCFSVSISVVSLVLDLSLSREAYNSTCLIPCNSDLGFTVSSSFSFKFHWFCRCFNLVTLILPSFNCWRVMLETVYNDMHRIIIKWPIGQYTMAMCDLRSSNHCSRNNKIFGTTSIGLLILNLIGLQ